MMNYLQQNIGKLQAGGMPTMGVDPQMLAQMMSEQGAGQGVDYNGEPTPNISGEPSFADMAQEIQERYDKLIIPLQRKLEKLKAKLKENPNDQTIKNEIKRLEEKIDQLEQQEDMELQQLEAEVEKSGEIIDQQKQMEGYGDVQEEMPEEDIVAQQSPEMMEQMQGEMPMMQKGGVVKMQSKGNPNSWWDMFKHKLGRIADEFAYQTNAVNHPTSKPYSIEDYGREVSQMDKSLPVLSKLARVNPLIGFGSIPFDVAAQKKGAIGYDRWKESLNSAALGSTLGMPTKYAWNILGGILGMNAANAGVTSSANETYDLTHGRTGYHPFSSTSDFLQKEYGVEPITADLLELGMGVPFGLGKPNTGRLYVGAPLKVADRVRAKTGMQWNDVKAAAKRDLGIELGSKEANIAFENAINEGKYSVVTDRNGNKMFVEREAGGSQTANGNAAGSTPNNKLLSATLKDVLDSEGLKTETVSYKQGDKTKRWKVNTIETADKTKYYISTEDNPSWASDNMNIINAKTGATRMAGEKSFSTPDKEIADLNLINKYDWGNFWTFLHPHIKATVRDYPVHSTVKPHNQVASFFDIWKRPEDVRYKNAKNEGNVINLGKVGTEWETFHGGYTPWQKTWRALSSLGLNSFKAIGDVIKTAGYLGRDLAVPATLFGVPTALWLYNKKGNIGINKKSTKEPDTQSIDVFATGNKDNTFNLQDTLIDRNKAKKDIEFLEGKSKSTSSVPNKQKGGWFGKLISSASKFPITDYLSIGHDIGKLFDDSGRLNIEAKKNLSLPSNNLWSSYSKAENDYRQQQLLDANNYQLNNIKAMRQQIPVGEYGSLHMNNMARVLNERLRQEALLNNQKAYNAATESTNKTLGSISQDAFKNALDRDTELAIAERDIYDQYYKDRNTLQNSKISTSDSIMTRIMNMGNQLKQNDEIWENYYRILRDENLTDVQKDMMLKALIFTGKIPTQTEE